MLDESLIGKKEPRPTLKCESCGIFFEDDDLGWMEWESVDDCGLCTHCKNK